MSADSGLAVSHKNQRDMRAFRLSNITLGLCEIRCGLFRSIVAIDLNIPNDSNAGLRPPSSPAQRHADKERPVFWLLAIEGTLAFVFCFLKEQGGRGSSLMYITCMGMFHVWLTRTVCIFLPPS
jgi:hypothetical protein